MSIGIALCVGGQAETSSVFCVATMMPTIFYVYNMNPWYAS